ncbi:serine/threonine-protein kinase [Saccharopolyspora cebuensis]|uniref:Serine/threonine-protein kinase n=1 Tax=Saccharopolyspora cebuensis TaxID=418759 RepID=A0ABV4CBP9_9PSEU
MQPLLASDPNRVGDYRLLARLGRGAMGGVYLGRSRGGRVVAVKVVRPDLAEDPEFRERFRREADMAGSVGGFWTAAVVGADPDADQPWLATEYVPGPTLHQAVSDHGALPEETVRGLAAGLAEALVAIHRAGLVHRDLKPANVLLGPDGPRVIDFGISRAMTGNALTATGMFLGTPGYFSPEQTSGGEIAQSSDVFSLGAVLVFAATASGPFGNDNTAAMLYRVVHSEPDLAAVPDRLRPLLADCLAKDPTARPRPEQLLDRIGETSPQGAHWLPPVINQVIQQHATELQQTTSAAPPDTAPPQPGSGTRAYTQAGAAPPQPGSGTRSYTQAGAAPVAAGAVAEPAPPRPKSHGDWAAPKPPAPKAPAPKEPKAPEPPAPKSAAPARSGEVARRDPIVPAAPRHTAPAKIAARVRDDVPGPVFVTAGKVAAFLWILCCVLVVAGLNALAAQVSVLPNDLDTIAFQVGSLLLVVSAAWSAVRLLVPKLKLKINPDGLRISRLGLHREIPWSQVRRVGVVGRGSAQYVAVWPVEGAAKPSTRPWHLVRSYHGGYRVYPIGDTGGWWRRRQEIRRVRSALQDHAPALYDSRLS